jgi:hypothetical protein
VLAVDLGMHSGEPTADAIARELTELTREDHR